MGLTVSQSNNNRGQIKSWFHTYVPANFTNVGKLVVNLIQSKNRAAIMAMLYALMGLVLTPLDWCLQVFEKKLYEEAPKSRLPQIFVCGAPRSGTTLVAQVLIKHLPVYYFNNLTSIFPRSPIISQKLFGFLAKNDNKAINFSSFYGRTSKLWYPNDALYLWDRWTGKNRKSIPVSFDQKAKTSMIRFFNAVEHYSKKPLVNKNNSLNSFANLVAETLPGSYFICLDRNPVYLAQSHLVARRFINADENRSYGIDLKESQDSTVNAIEDICKQVAAHKKMIKHQQSLIGSERFIILKYEDFCEDPAKFVAEVAKKCLGMDSFNVDNQHLRAG
jgi:hypothetical protein